MTHLEDIDFVELLDNLPDSFPDTAVDIEPPPEFAAKMLHDCRNMSGLLATEDIKYFYVDKALKILIEIGAIEYDWIKHAEYHGSGRKGKGIDTTTWYRKKH